MRDVVMNAKFENTCELLYEALSERVNNNLKMANEKRREKKPEKILQKDIKDSTLVSNLLKNKRIKGRNEYLITDDIINILTDEKYQPWLTNEQKEKIKDLGFLDNKNFLLWGITDKEEIYNFLKNFYLHLFDDMKNNKNEEYQQFIDKFLLYDIDYTYNKFYLETARIINKKVFDMKVNKTPDLKGILDQISVGNSDLNTKWLQQTELDLNFTNPVLDEIFEKMNEIDPRFTINYRKQLLKDVEKETKEILSEIFEKYNLTDQFDEKSAQILVFDMFFFDFYHIYANFFGQYSTYKKLPKIIEKFSKNLVDKINEKYPQSEKIYNNLKNSLPSFDVYIQETDALTNIEKYDKKIFSTMLSYVHSLRQKQKELIENQREIIVISDLPTDEMIENEKGLEGFKLLRIK